MYVLDKVSICYRLHDSITYIIWAYIYIYTEVYEIQKWMNELKTTGRNVPQKSLILQL